MKPSSLAAAAGILLAAAAPAAAQHAGAGHAMILPEDLKWVDVPSLPPGARIAVIEGPLDAARPITARIRFPANYRLPAHHHPVIEHVTVLSGTFNMGMGETFDRTRTKALTQGGFALMQPGTPHFAWTDRQTVVQIHSVGPWGVTYVNPAEDPRRK